MLGSEERSEEAEADHVGLGEVDAEAGIVWRVVFRCSRSGKRREYDGVVLTTFNFLRGCDCEGEGVE